MNKRDTTLDSAKGFLIILVVLGHSIQYSLGYDWLISGQFFDDVVFKTIYSFHMPLFMLISGYLFYYSNKKDFKTLAASKLKAIGIPMLSFVFLYNASQYLPMLVHGEVLEVLGHYFRSIFFEMIMWFLVSLLLNMAVVAVLTRLFKSTSLQYLVMVALSVASLFIPDAVVLSVYKYMFPFFCIGYVVRQNELPLYASSGNKPVLGVLTIVSAVAVWWFDRETYIYTSGFCILGDCARLLLIDCKRMVIALVVSYTFMQYAYLFARRANIMVYWVSRLGQMSLFIYGMNIVFNLNYSKLLSALSLNFEFNYLIPVATTAVFVLVCCWLYRLFEKTKFTRVALLGKTR